MQKLYCVNFRHHFHLALFAVCLWYCWMPYTCKGSVIYYSTGTLNATLKPMLVLLFIFSAVFIRLPRSYTLILWHLHCNRLSTLSIYSLLSCYSHSTSVFTLHFPEFYFNATSWFVLAEKLYVYSANAHDVFINPAAVFHMRLMAQLRFSLTLTSNTAITYQIDKNILFMFGSLKTTHIFSWCIAQLGQQGQQIQEYVYHLYTRWFLNMVIQMRLTSRLTSIRPAPTHPVSDTLIIW